MTIRDPYSSVLDAGVTFSSSADRKNGVLDALRYVCEDVTCVENQREASALLCALAVPFENKLPLAESGLAEPLTVLCQSPDVEVPI